MSYGSYTYPGWTTIVGWMIAVFPMLPIPATMFYVLWKSPGDTMLQVIGFSEVLCFNVILSV